MTSNGKPDIDEAIAKAQEASEDVIEMYRGQAAFNTSGRPFEVMVPSDLTHQEALALCGYIVQLQSQLASRKRSPLVLPGHQA